MGFLSWKPIGRSVATQGHANMACLRNMLCTGISTDFPKMQDHEIGNAVVVSHNMATSFSMHICQIFPLISVIYSCQNLQYIGESGVIKPVATGHWLPPVWITQIMLL